MARTDTLTNFVTDIADAIRAKKGTSGSIACANFDTEIASISSGGITPSGTKNITSNGVVDVTNYANANVNVPVGVFPSGTKNITSNGIVTVTNYDKVNVNVPQGITPSGTIEIDENGTYDITDYASAIINVEGGGDMPFLYDDYAITTTISDCKTLTFEHSLGIEPKNCVVIAYDINDIYGVSPYKVIEFNANVMSAVGCALCTGNDKNYRSSALSGFTKEYTEDSITVTFTNTTYNFMGGVDYVCLIWA